MVSLSEGGRRGDGWMDREREEKGRRRRSSKTHRQAERERQEGRESQ